MNINELAKIVDERSDRLRKALAFSKREKSFDVSQQAFLLALKQIDDLTNLLREMSGSADLWHNCFLDEQKKNNYIKAQSPGNGANAHLFSDCYSFSR